MSRARRTPHDTSYDEDARRRFGSGDGRFGFGAGGGNLSRVFALFVVLLLIAVGRLFWLQVIRHDELSSKADIRRTSVQEVLARRGTIFDRNGNVLAKSVECYDVYCNPLEVTDAKAEAALVAKWLGGDAAVYEDKMAQETTFVYLVRWADKDTCESLRAELLEGEHAGVYLIPQMRREYPYGSVAGQILGMLSMDGKTKTGLELAYDEQLSGVDGEITVQVGNNGVPIAGAQAQVQTQPRDGQDIVLSLDIDVQKYVEEQVAQAVEKNKAASGFAMVCDPRTGAIIAACSTPYADLTDMDHLSSEALNLKLVSSTYEPGSIFKVLTAAMALESGALKAGDYFTVPPTIWVGTGLVADEDGRMQYEDMNLREILRRSSNVGAVMVAEEYLGKETFAQGVASFGIGEPTGIDYPGETTGIVKQLEEYDPASLGSMSFGQGLSIPMVQMVRAVGSIANGGVLLAPHFAVSVGGSELDWSSDRYSVSESTCERVADMMQTVVEEGTGYSAAVEGYSVAAKTGTGEQAENGKYIEGKFLASLIGFAPVQSPEVLIYVGLNETPYLSYTSAGPLFSAIMGEVLADMGVLSDP